MRFAEAAVIVCWETVVVGAHHFFVDYESTIKFHTSCVRKNIEERTLVF